MPKMKKDFTEKDLVVGRLVSEDKDFMTIEVLKDNNNHFTLREGDQFYTLIFTAGKPWEQKR